MRTRTHIVFTLLGLGISATLVFGQSLAEVAKKERERRKANQEEQNEPVRVVDDEGLRDVTGPSVVVESTVETVADEGDDRARRRRDAPMIEPIDPDDRDDPIGLSGNCASLDASIRSAERRLSAGVTVTERVPGRVARGVRTMGPNGTVITSDIPTYEEREKHVSCSSSEGRNTRECQSLRARVESLRAQRRKCQ